MWNRIKEKFKKGWKWILSSLGVGGAVVLALTLPNGAVIERATGCDEALTRGEESLFAETDANGNVLRVIVIDCEVLMSGKWGEPKNWVRTYKDGRERYNYAGKGYEFDKDRDAFIPSKPDEDAIFDEVRVKWVEPADVASK